jgi:hypothetical protein
LNEHGDESTEPREERRFFKWELIVVFMGGLMLLLAFQLWRRLDRVDPLLRCAGAYEGVHTAVDSSLVDRISVRWPDRDTRTTCGALREAGELARLPRRQPTGGGIMPPRPR